MHIVFRKGDDLRFADGELRVKLDMRRDHRFDLSRYRFVRRLVPAVIASLKNLAALGCHPVVGVDDRKAVFLSDA